jgi:hypothetical protein
MCFAGGGSLQAAPFLGVSFRLPWTRTVAQVTPPTTDQVLPTPPPVPSPTPAPVAGSQYGPRSHSFLGQGPIVIRGDGNYELGINRGTRYGISDDYDNYETALSVVVERRTEQSSISVTNAFGYSGGGGSAGGLVATYRTPKFGLSYGQVAGPSDTQLDIGGFARGLSLDFPVRNGDIEYLASSAQQSDGSTYRIYGIHRSLSILGGYLDASYYRGNSESSDGRESVADVDFRHYGAKLSTTTEFAVSDTHDVPDGSDGARLASAFHADLTGKNTFATLTVQYSPVGFESLTGNLDGGLITDLALRRHSDRYGDFTLDFGHDDERVPPDIEHDNRVTVSGGKSFGSVGYQYVYSLEGTTIGGATTLNHNAALTVNEQFGSMNVFETAQRAIVDSTLGGAAQTQYALGLSRPAFGGSIAYQIATGSSLAQSSTGTSAAQTISFHRPIGRKTDFSIGEGYQSTSNNGMPTHVIDTSVNIIRRLSQVVAISVTGDRFTQTGLGGGSGTQFSASLVGPFGFGQPTSGGRVNPNLPSVIRGTVTLTQGGGTLSYNTPVSHGYNNALIILDGRISQRTDSSGSFEFRFIPSGEHTLRLDPATLAPGLIPDREYVTLKLLGGQTTTVGFAVGNFAGINGTVTSTDAHGKHIPIGGVGIAVDGVQAVTTSPDGRYAVGRLNTGAHTVEIVEATVPSTVQFADRKRTVTVSTGTSIAVNFAAVPLGSISGSVLAPADGGFGAEAGVNNAYVVAEPGEHAAITDSDGAFLLDNLPPGDYTLTVDPETIADDMQVISGPDGPIRVSGGADQSGVVFKLAAAAKAVIYTYSGAGKKKAITVTADPMVAPPGALLRVTARTAAKVKVLNVESDVFGSAPLNFNEKSDAWTGSVIVPSLAKGNYALTVTAHSPDVEDGETLIAVNPAIEPFTVLLKPSNPEPGSTVRVLLRSLLPLEEGDYVTFQDGYRIRLPKPRGRIFDFEIRLWRKGLPYTAQLTTRAGHTYPIVLR